MLYLAMIAAAKLVIYTVPFMITTGSLAVFPFIGYPDIN